MHISKIYEDRSRYKRPFKAKLQTAIILCVLCLYIMLASYYKVDKPWDFVYTKVISNESDNIKLKGSFKLDRIYRHGIGSEFYKHQVLDINEENLQLLAKNYEVELDKLHTTDAEDEELEELWTSNALYKRENPFTFEFKLSGSFKNLQRMVERDPEFVEAYIDSTYGSQSVFAENDKQWIEGGEDAFVPNVKNKDTVIALALMSSNAYVKLPQTGDWRNVTEPWNQTDSQSYGWDSDGIRGHIFYNEIDDIVVISIKGTSAHGIPGAGDDETTARDKLNDNLLFSCCCARVSYLWTTVCDCYTKSYTCDESCLEQSIKRKDGFYKAVMDIYKDVLITHPTATVWLTGHSLGGSLASLLGRTFGLPAITFEAPGEELAAKRLHLPFPPGIPEYAENIWHIGHTADPIFMGTCNGASSSCSIAGYAMETQCHSGYECIYDAVKDKGWHMNMLNHRIHTVIDGILTQYDEVPKCIRPENCIDCYNWDFIPAKDYTSSKTKTSTKTNTKPITTSTECPTTTTSRTCIGRNWLGICTEYGPDSYSSFLHPPNQLTSSQ